MSLEKQKNEISLLKNFIILKLVKLKIKWKMENLSNILHLTC